MTSLVEPNFKSQRLVCPGLPLAVYREVAAHLQQVEAVEVSLLPQLATSFDYAHSQVGGLSLDYTAKADSVTQQRVQQILAYYGGRYGQWQTLE